MVIKKLLTWTRETHRLFDPLAFYPLLETSTTCTLSCGYMRYGPFSAYNSTLPAYLWLSSAFNVRAISPCQTRLFTYRSCPPAQYARDTYLACVTDVPD